MLENPLLITVATRSPLIPGGGNRRRKSIATENPTKRVKLLKEEEVSVLHNKLEKLKQALDESRQETKLAAKTGHFK